MYKLSYEKCVCFVLLVMVALLTCSGFRIDSGFTTSMTDLTKKPSYSSDFSSSSSRPSASADFVNRLFEYESRVRIGRSAPGIATHTNTATSSIKTHRIRHSRRSRPHPSHHVAADAGAELTSNYELRSLYPSLHQQHNKSPSPIDTKTMTTTTTIRPEQQPHLAQIPAASVLIPLKPTVVTRSQRSSPGRIRHHQKQQQGPKHHQKNRQSGGGKHNIRSPCQLQDVARKAYLANTVVLAKADSRSSNRVHNYSVTFNILRTFKSEYPVDSTLRLTFENNTKHLNCERTSSSSGYVKAQIRQSMEYFLFLNSNGSHHYTVIGMPVLNRKNKDKNTDLQDILRVTNGSFVPKPPKPTIKKLGNGTHLEPKNKLRLECKVQGFPIPIISWKKNGTTLESKSNKLRISYKRKRMTLLVIKQVEEKDSGRYQCVARSMNGTEYYSVPADIRISNKEKCNTKYSEFCQNGGTCFENVELHEMFCSCAEGFKGAQCENKEVPLLNSASMNNSQQRY